MVEKPETYKFCCCSALGGEYLGNKVCRDYGPENRVETALKVSFNAFNE